LALAFVMAITLGSLVGQVGQFWAKAHAADGALVGASLAHCAVGVLLIALAAFVTWESSRALLRR